MAATTTGAQSNPSRTRLLAGPLTTHYTPAEQCSGCTFFGTSTDPPVEGYGEACYMFNRVGPCPGMDPPDCFPDMTNYKGQMQTPGWFYSPGLYCPQGWRTVAMATSGEGHGSPYVSGILMTTLWPDETAAVCCPSGLTYFQNDGAFGGFCHHDLTTKTAVYTTCYNNTTLVDVTKTDIGGIMTYTWTQDGPQTTTRKFASVVVWALTVQLVYRPQDLTISPPTATNPSSATADPTTRASQTTSAATEIPRSDNGSSSNNLGYGTIGGISAGIVAFLIGVGVVLVLWRWRRKRSGKDSGGKPRMPDGDGGGGGDGYTKPELEAISFNPNRVTYRKAELEAQNRFELDGASGHRVYELYGNQTFVPHELAAPATGASRPH